MPARSPHQMRAQFSRGARVVECLVPTGHRVVYEVIRRQYERGSMVITSNRAMEE